jgi:hypothetical protein
MNPDLATVVTVDLAPTNRIRTHSSQPFDRPGP